MSDIESNIKKALAEVEAKRKAALELFGFEAEATKPGESAGSRKEGARWAKQMAALLERPGYQIQTTTGKSSDGKKLDGNAHERIAFKMMSFKMDPLQSDRHLVIAINRAFSEYRAHFYAEVVAMAATLNAKSSGNPIIVLGVEKSYKEYFDRWARDIENGSVPH